MRRTLLAAVVTLAIVPTTAAAQGAEETPIDSVTEFLTGTGTLELVVAEFLLVALVGLFTVALFDDWSEQALRNARGSTVRSFLLGIPGFVALLGLLFVAYLLILTFFGMLLGVPLGVVVMVLFLVYSTVGYVAAGGFLASRAGSDNVAVAALVGAALSAVLGVLPYLGPAVSILIVCVGVGASLRASFGSGGPDASDRSVPTKHQFIK